MRTHPPSRDARIGSLAAAVAAVVTLAAMAVGLAIGVKLGVASGIGVAGSTADTLRRIAALLFAAEWLKMAAGIAAAAAVWAVRRVVPLAPPLRANGGAVLGYAGALAIFAAGALGHVAVAALGGTWDASAIGRLVALLGLVAAPLTALWAWLAAAGSDRLPRWLRIVARALVAVALAALLLPPLGLLFGLLSLAWWIGLSRALGRAARG
jgi:hypothetical protein